MSASRGRPATTTVAGWSAIVLSTMWLALGASFWVLGTVLAAIGRDQPWTVVFGATLPEVTDFLQVAGAVVVILAVAAAVVSVQALRRRRWARWAGVVAFGGVGLLGTLAPLGVLGGQAVGDLTVQVNQPDVGGVVLMAAHLAVAVLLAVPATGRDVAAHRAHRDLRARAATVAAPGPGAPGAP